MMHGMHLESDVQVSVVRGCENLTAIVQPCNQSTREAVIIGPAHDTQMRMRCNRLRYCTSRRRYHLRVVDFGVEAIVKIIQGSFHQCWMWASSPAPSFQVPTITFPPGSFLAFSPGVQDLGLVYYIRHLDTHTRTMT